MLLPVGGHLISTAICYEIVYPNLVRQFVLRGSELLTTITNDAWFGSDLGAVPAFRAGLDARDRGRALSGPVRQYRHQRHRRSRTGGCSLGRTIDEPAVMVGEARFLRTTTLYTRIGDVVAYASVVVTARARRAHETACTMSGLRTSGSWLWPSQCPKPRAQSQEPECRLSTN